MPLSGEFEYWGKTVTEAARRSLFCLTGAVRECNSFPVHTIQPRKADFPGRDSGASSGVRILWHVLPGTCAAFAVVLRKEFVELIQAFLAIDAGSRNIT